MSNIYFIVTYHNEQIHYTKIEIIFESAHPVIMALKKNIKQDEFMGKKKIVKNSKLKTGRDYRN